MLKLQINSLEALERLIGNDTEVEIDIRNSIVHNFTMKHLKAIANQEFVIKATKALEKQMTDSFLVYGSNLNGLRDPEFTPQVKKMLDDAAINYGKEIVNKIVEEKLNVEFFKKELEDALNRQVDRIETTLTESIINKRLDDMVNKRIKEKLGL